MLPGEMADGVETREQRRRRRIGLGLDPDGESEYDTGDGPPGDGGRGPPRHGDGDGGDTGDGHGGGPGGPGDEEGEEESINSEDDAATRAFKRQTNSLVMLAKSIKDLVSKKEDHDYRQATGYTDLLHVVSREPPSPTSRENISLCFL